MKIPTVTILSIIAVFLNSIESSHAWIGRKSGKIAPEPRLHIPIHSYEDDADRIHQLTVESKVTLGIRQLEVGGVRGDYIIGIVKLGVIRPILDSSGIKFIVCMRHFDKYGLLTTNGIPYGLKPQHTVEAIVIAPPTTV